MPLLQNYIKVCHASRLSLITSQNATAPKPAIFLTLLIRCLITSQNATAPKHLEPEERDPVCLITSQNATAPKLTAFKNSAPVV